MRRGFSCYHDPTKATSGQRFFGALCAQLRNSEGFDSENPEVVLFNVSAPLREIVREKLRGRKIVVRLDGLYFDRLSTKFLETFPLPLRAVLKLGTRFRPLHDPLAHIANFWNANYSAFARILLADHVIYQSEFSRAVHQHYFKSKPCFVIPNGAVFEGWSERTGGEEIRLLTIHDGWRPSKRIHDIVTFVEWMRRARGVDAKLTILGYDGRLPYCAPAHVRGLIEASSFVRTSPRFREINAAVREAFAQADMFITFSDRDACPNALIESMAHGLPVVGLASGGVPDIVGNAGILFPAEGGNLYFCSARYECAFAPVPQEALVRAILELKANLATYRSRVKERFATVLGLPVVAERYAAALRSLVSAR